MKLIVVYDLTEPKVISFRGIDNWSGAVLKAVKLLGTTSFSNNIFFISPFQLFSYIVGHIWYQSEKNVNSESICFITKRVLLRREHRY